MRRRPQRSHIRLLSVILLGASIFPYQAKATFHERAVPHFEAHYLALLGEYSLQNTPWIESVPEPPPVPKRANKAKSAGGDPRCGSYLTQCVCWAKTLTGHYGTWGNGGRYLSDNSGPAVGAVIVFRNTHVGVITAVDGLEITFTDRNYDLRVGVRVGVRIGAADPSIWKFHKF